MEVLESRSAILHLGCQESVLFTDTASSKEDQKAKQLFGTEGSSQEPRTARPLSSSLKVRCGSKADSFGSWCVRIEKSPLLAKSGRFGNRLRERYEPGREENSVLDAKLRRLAASRFRHHAFAGLGVFVEMKGFSALHGRAGSGDFLSQ